MNANHIFRVNYIVSKDTINIALIDEIGQFSTYRLSPSKEHRETIIKLIKEAVKEKSSDKLKEVLSPAYRISHLTDGRFEFDGNNQMFLKGTDVPISSLLSQRLLWFIQENKTTGTEVYPLDALVKFWLNCLLNPDIKATEGLYRFLEHNGHPITSNGYFIAYKRVNVKPRYGTKTGELIEEKFYDQDTGALLPQVFNDKMNFTDTYTGKVLYKIGEAVCMPRTECDSDPGSTCSSGLHVGSMEYVGDYGNKKQPVVECLVNPRHVVAVPHDYQGTKMRVCQLYVLGLCNGERTTHFVESDYETVDMEALRAEYAQKQKELTEAKLKQDAIIEKLDKQHEV